MLGIGDTLRTIFDLADADGTTPLEAAQALAASGSPRPRAATPSSRFRPLVEGPDHEEGQMRRSWQWPGAVAGSIARGAGGAQAADPPPGAAMSDNLEYVTRVADAAGIVEGKFDSVKGKDVLVVTGRFGFKTYDVSDPARARSRWTSSCRPTSRPGGYWQNEDMELDTSAS